MGNVLNLFNVFLPLLSSKDMQSPIRGTGQTTRTDGRLCTPQGRFDTGRAEAEHPPVRYLLVKFLSWRLNETRDANKFES